MSSARCRLRSALLCWPRDNILTYRSERFPRMKVNKTAGVGSQGVSYLELLTNFRKIWTLFLSLREAASFTCGFRDLCCPSVINFVDKLLNFTLVGTFNKEKTIEGNLHPNSVMSIYAAVTINYTPPPIASSLWRPINPRLDSIVKVNSLNIKYCENFLK